MNRIMVFICPKCAQYAFHINNSKNVCEYCHTELIETKYYLNDFMNVSLDKNYPLAFKEYVESNPLYNPDEETRSYIKRQAKEQTAKILDHQRVEAYRLEQEENVPRCPTCKSTNVQKISTVKKAVSIGTLGLLSSSIGKTMQCKDCGYKW